MKKRSIMFTGMSISTALILSLSITFSAIGAEKLAVKDLVGNKTFVVDENGTIYSATNISIGKTIPLSRNLVDAEGYDGTGNGLSFAIRNKSTSNSFAVFDMKVGSGNEGGKVFGSRVAINSYGIANGFTFSPGTATQDLGFRVGAALTGQAMGPALIIKSSGNVGIGTITPSHLLQLAGGAYSDGATWTNASSRALKENIKDVSVIDAIATLEKLEPVQYNYKKDKSEQYVGFIAEDVPDLVATNDRKGISTMDVTAVLTKVVQEQQKMLKELKAQVAELKFDLEMKRDKDLNVSR